MNGGRIFAHQVANLPGISRSSNHLPKSWPSASKWLTCPAVVPPRPTGWEFDEPGQTLSAAEKPARPRTRYAAPALYFYDNHVADMARDLRPSARGELETIDLNRIYLEPDTCMSPVAPPLLPGPLVIHSPRCPRSRGRPPFAGCPIRRPRRARPSRSPLSGAPSSMY
ncbi:sugar phosphate nucleotidyltransferase [Streptomyces sp. NPDC096354]|uniref:sugar phosphate nucleotidyltransferase n=1 Tax=Streptomyces sp. NPDC096354 TaxID=3366088 RepID=UPI00380136A7